MSLTSKHFFCGAGGDTSGLAAAGFAPVYALNHDQVSIDTHSANFPDCEHKRADIENVEMRRLPRTDVLWASPICTEISPAGGRRRRPAPGQASLFEEERGDDTTDDNFLRTRVTALSIISATETHRYDVVMGENVVEFGTDWELFRWWIQGMRILGYSHQLISVNAAHISTTGNQAAPQWRDRLFFIFARDGVKIPKLHPRPVAWCPQCCMDVRAVQWWKDPKKTIGKYRVQYLYRCPNSRCRHAIVEPYVRAAAEILDFSNTGTRIGDRRRPLKENTLRRIRAGLAALGQRRMMLSVNHGGDDARAYLPGDRPLPSRTVKIGDGLLTPPMLVPCGGSRNDTAHPADRPMRTLLTRQSDALVTTDAFIAELRRNGSWSPTSQPLSTITSGGNHHALVMPYYSNGKAVPADEPLTTVTTKARHALISGQKLDVEDCHLRMVQPAEQFASQRFPDGYKRCGNKTQQTAQAGNAVPVNVAQWIGEHVYAALAQTSAA